MIDAVRFGFIAILGAPNAGKSTLINRIVGAKVTIVSPKVQTTRTRVLGIVARNKSQLVFVDTPGIFAPRRRLDRAMVDAAWKGAADADILVLLVDSERGFNANTRRIVEQIKGDAVLVLNKIDQVRHEKLLALSKAINEAGTFRETFMISALKGDGVEDLTDYLAASVPAGVWMFPEDQLSDMPMRLMAAEIVREQLFLQLRDSHKGMVLGKGGQRIKAVGAAAREELKVILQCKVHLFLHVKVRPDWKDKAEHYHALGLDFPN